MGRITRTNASTLLSQAVEYHGFVFTQGVTSTDLSLDIKGQTHNILKQLDHLLEEHGTDNTRLLQAQIWLKSINDRNAFNEIWAEWLPKGLAPARACVQATLADPNMLVEVMLTTTK